MANEQKKFQQIIDVSLEFAQAKDVDLLLEKILRAAIKLGNAEAGALYFTKEETLQLHHTQNGAAATPRYQPTPVPLDPASLVAYAGKTGEIVNIPDLAQFPQNVPYSLEHSFNQNMLPPIRAILAVPLKNDQRKVLGVIQLFNPRSDAGETIRLSEDDAPLIRLFAANATNAIERAQATGTRIMGILQVLTTLRNTEETIGHFNRVGAYAVVIYERWARKKGLPQAAIEAQKNTLRMAAMLHDIGKLAIPNIIRGKPGKLTAEEYELMKQHTFKGAQLLFKYAQSEIENVAAEIALNHHEYWDGTGYPGHIELETGQVLPGYVDQHGQPRGKKGAEIPVFGRIVAIADVYEALLSARVYRNAWKEADVLVELRKGTGTQFDPEMIDAFFDELATIHAVARRYPD